MDFKRKNLELLEKKLYRRKKQIEKQVGKYIYINNEKYLDFSSNNYLGLKDDKRVIEASKLALNRYGLGSGASRLVTGNTEIHEKLEYTLSKYKKKEKTLLFNSGYDANLGIISSLVKKGDLILSDKLNHASIIDGVLLSGAKLLRYKHNDLKDLEKKLEKNISDFNNVLVVTDTVFSMDGDICKLEDIIKLKKKYKFLLYVDEAHATGIFGINGMGISEEKNIQNDIDIIMGTLGKAYGSQGAYVSSSKDIIDYCINKVRSFIYTTALSPVLVAGAQKALEISISEKERKLKVLELSRYMIKELKILGYNTLNSNTQIIPIVIPGNEKVLKLSENLKEKKIMATAIRKPTVPKNFERIRVSINYNLDREDINYFLSVLI